MRHPRCTPFLTSFHPLVDGTQGVWDIFGKVVEPLASTVPFLLGIGNHEWLEKNNTFKSFTSRLRTPAVGGASQLYYSYEIGLAHLIILQGYCPEMSSILTQPCLAAGSAQMDWLLTDLAGVDRNGECKVMTVHSVGYGCASARTHAWSPSYSHTCCSHAVGDCHSASAVG